MSEDDKLHGKLMKIMERLAAKESMTDFENKIFDAAVDPIAEYENDRWPINKTSEEEQPKTIEWYQTQAKELLDIRKSFYKLLGDMTNGDDAYFPDLVKKEFEKLKTIQENLKSRKR